LTPEQRKRDKKRRIEDANQAARPVPSPKWVQAFLIMLLHKNGGSLTMSFDDLARFEALEGDNQTSLSYDDVKRTVTVTAPEMIMPDKKIIVPDKRVISN